LRTSVALPILSYDASSSVAYGPAAMLAELAQVWQQAFGLSHGLSVGSSF
jgi:hypothetical protein